MFYCEPCRVQMDWPDSFVRSYGPCELCRKSALCYDRPSSSLPDPKPKENKDERQKASS